MAIIAKHAHFALGLNIAKKNNHPEEWLFLKYDGIKLISQITQIETIHK